MADAPRGAAPFRTIEALAERCGHYCWTESRLFALTGAWSALRCDAHPEVVVRLSEMSTEHALLATQWGDRLPVRAGVDAAALVVAPPGPLAEALALLATAPSALAGLAGLVAVVLPRVLASYREDLEHASPVSEAPVRAVLGAAIRASEGEISAGQGLLAGLVLPPETAAISSQFCQQMERPFEGSRGIVPAARAS